MSNIKNIIWSDEKCKNEALQYNTRREFAINSGSAYNYARHNNILNIVCKHMIIKRKPSGYWTFEKCKNEALLYQTRNEYRIMSGSSYDRALKNNWLDDICSHMKLIGNQYRRCIYACEFSDNSVYVGLTYNFVERQKNRVNNINDSVTIHINKTKLTPVIKQLCDYVDVKIASKLECDFLNKYIQNGWNILNKNKTGGIGGNYYRWDKEKCVNIAKRCNSKKEFYLNYRGAYVSSIKNGWISEIYKIFNSDYQKKYKYTKEYCKNEACKYRTKKEFKKNNMGAYNASLRNLWHSEICKHMTHKNTKWTKEKCEKIAIFSKNKVNFRKNYSGAYYCAWRNGWLDDFFLII